jgi:hypothetical protein
MESGGHLPQRLQNRAWRCFVRTKTDHENQRGWQETQTSYECKSRRKENGSKRDIIGETETKVQSKADELD